MYYPEVPGTGNDHGLGQIARLMATASAKLSHIPSHARDGSVEGAVEGAEVGNLAGFGIGPPDRESWSRMVITPRSSADLKRPPLVVVLAFAISWRPMYAEQISHGSPKLNKRMDWR